MKGPELGKVWGGFRVKSVKDCPEWRKFKEKWDGKKPRKGSRQHGLYQSDAWFVGIALKEYLKP